MNGEKIKTIIAAVMLVMIVILSGVGIKNVIAIKNANKNVDQVWREDESGNKQKPTGTLTEEMSKIYDSINDYGNKVNEIMEYASHDNDEEIQKSINQLKDIKKDIEENHKDFKNYNAGVDLNKNIEASIAALESQLFLNNLETEE